MRFDNALHQSVPDLIFDLNTVYNCRRNKELVLDVYKMLRQLNGFKEVSKNQVPSPTLEIRVLNRMFDLRVCSH